MRTKTKTGFYRMHAQIFLLFAITLAACTTMTTKKESIAKDMSTSTADVTNNQELRFAGTIKKYPFRGSIQQSNWLVDDCPLR